VSHLFQHETHQNQPKFAVRRIAEVYQMSSSSSPENATAQRTEDRLRHLAVTDALTGLANYRRLSEAVESEIKRSERTARAFAVLIFDLNGMKRIKRQHDSLPPFASVPPG
jgi:PleD family two-component response regulator